MATCTNEAASPAAAQEGREAPAPAPAATVVLAAVKSADAEAEAGLAGPRLGLGGVGSAVVDPLVEDPKEEGVELVQVEGPPAMVDSAEASS